jgi:hypothetical protein
LGRGAHQDKLVDGGVPIENERFQLCVCLFVWLCFVVCVCLFGEGKSLKEGGRGGRLHTHTLSNSHNDTAAIFN